MISQADIAQILTSSRVVRVTINKRLAVSVLDLVPQSQACSLKGVCQRAKQVVLENADLDSNQGVTSALLEDILIGNVADGEGLSNNK